MLFRKAFELMKQGMKVKTAVLGWLLVLVKGKADDYHAHQRWY